jgi:hypothetical protein
LVLEALEDRLTPSNVSATVSGATLTIAETSGDDVLTVTAAGNGTLAVTTAAGNTINNSLSTFTTPVAIAALTIHLSTGNDLLTLDGVTNGAITLAGNLDITGTGGNKTITATGVQLEGTSNLTVSLTGNGDEVSAFNNVVVPGAASFSHPGVGNTSLALNTSVAPIANEQWGSLTINNGQGSDAAAIDCIDFAGNVTINNGPGAAGVTGGFGGSLDFLGDVVNHTTGPATIGGNLVITTASGEAAAELYRYNVTGNANISTGPGIANQTVKNFVSIAGAVIGGNTTITGTTVSGASPGLEVDLIGTVNGKLSITANGTGSADVTLTDLSVPNGNTTISLGSHTSGDVVTFVCSIGQARFNSLNINSAAGGDNAFGFQESAAFPAGMVFAGAVNVQLGPGNDSLSFYSFGIPGTLSFLGSAHFDGGSGTNQLGFPGEAMFQTPPVFKNFPGSTSMQLNISHRRAAFGEPVQVHVHLQAVAHGAATPTGLVVLKDGATQIDSGMVDSNGDITFTAANLLPGAHDLSVNYEGNGAFITSAATAHVSIVKIATTVSLTVGPNPAALGTSVGFISVVVPSIPSPWPAIPSGTVTYKDGSKVLGTGPGVDQNGIALFSTTGLSTGKHTITATYSGDSTYQGSKSTAVVETIGPVGTHNRLELSNREIVYGQPLTLTATVSMAHELIGNTQPARPTGMMTFWDGASQLGSANVNNGVATITVSGLSPGRIVIVADYYGDTVFEMSKSASVVVQVNAPPLQLTWATPAPIAYGTALGPNQLDATANIPGTFTYNPGAGAVLDPGTATLSVTFTPSDTRDYLPPQPSGWTKSVVLTINPSDTQVQASDAGGVYNAQPFPASATATSLTTGAVIDTSPDSLLTFTYYVGADITGTNLGGNAPSNAGTYSVVAHYAGDSDCYPADSTVVTFTISPASQSTPTVEVSATSGTYNGQPAAVTATVAGTDGVQGSTLEGVGLSLGYYVIYDNTPHYLGTNAPIVAGTYEVIATFGGSLDYSVASSSTTYTIGQAAPVIAVSTTSGYFNGQPVAVTATVAGVVSGMDDTPGPTLEGIGLTLQYYQVFANGSSDSLTSAPTTPGNYLVVASFAGSTDYASRSSQPASFTIYQALPNLQLTDASGTYNGQPYAATTSIWGVVAGVDDTPGPSLEGVYLSALDYQQLDPNGNVEYDFGTAAPTLIGSYRVTVSFAGSADYAPLTALVDFTINPSGQR